MSMRITTETITLIKKASNPFIEAGIMKGDEFNEALRRMKLDLQIEIKPQLYRRKETAAMLGVSLRTLARLLEEGTLTPIHIGRRSIRISDSEIRALIGGVK